MVETTQKIKEDKAFNEEYMIHSRQNSQNDLVKNNYIDGPIKLTKKPKENHVKLLNIFKSKLKVFSKIAKETRHESTKKTTTKDSSYSLNDIDNKFHSTSCHHNECNHKDHTHKHYHHGINSIFLKGKSTFLTKLEI